ncbi:hypothetical protein [Ktedonobacter racemifer]|uniref:hypothetical protein n=1 Tax=Ktedonobacter racemifer TaxID=363277 RepID=UPI00058AD323|nr:hypothetical protein [Ktedonobacter racemifer]
MADKQKHSSSIAAVLKRHNVAESAKIGHKMAESTIPENGFYRLLVRSQQLTAEKTLSQEQDLSVKTQSEKQPERDILTASAILCRESQKGPKVKAFLGQDNKADATRPADYILSRSCCIDVV